MWKRRVSIICQLGLKQDTDLALLYDCIEPNLDDREFFVRKAIGWALRDYAWGRPLRPRARGPSQRPVPAGGDQEPR
jgi:3-methyladenine DNA glycosylase AlkD